MLKAGNKNDDLELRSQDIQTLNTRNFDRIMLSKNIEKLEYAHKYLKFSISVCPKTTKIVRSRPTLLQQ